MNRRKIDAQLARLEQSAHSLVAWTTALDSSRVSSATIDHLRHLIASCSKSVDLLAKSAQDKL